MKLMAPTKDKIVRVPTEWVEGASHQTMVELEEHLLAFLLVGVQVGRVRMEALVQLLVERQEAVVQAQCVNNMIQTRELVI